VNQVVNVRELSMVQQSVMQQVLYTVLVPSFFRPEGYTLLLCALA